MFAKKTQTMHVGGPTRAGISLMEVLISIFVVSIGLLGIAALIPVANYSLVETSKSDRTAACGQAAMRDVRVRALADPQIWSLVRKSGGSAYTDTTGASYVIDPLGDSGVSFGQVPVVTYKGITTAVSESFYWQDDLLFDMGQDDSTRPKGFDWDSDGTLDGPIAERSYSWFLTVTPSPMLEGTNNERRQCTVSVVVCHKRNFDTPTSTDEVDLSGTGNNVLVTNTPSGAIVSGIQLADSQDLETGQWVMLSGPDERHSPVIAQWYRITAGYETFFSLEGPNWPSTGGTNEIPNRMLVIPGVLGVYTTTVELNRAPQWLR